MLTSLNFTQDFWPIHWQSIQLTRTQVKTHRNDLQEEFLKENRAITAKTSAHLIRFLTVHLKKKIFLIYQSGFIWFYLTVLSDLDNIVQDF